MFKTLTILTTSLLKANCLLASNLPCRSQNRFREYLTINAKTTDEPTILKYQHVISYINEYS